MEDCRWVQVLPTVGNCVNVKGQEAAKAQWLHSIDRIASKVEFPASRCMLALEDQITFISVIDVLLKLTLDLECRWPRAAWNFHMLSLLVKDAEGRR